MVGEMEVVVVDGIGVVVVNGLRFRYGFEEY